jgi:hypothetical protein
MKRAGRVEQTESEKAFETFLSVNNLPFQRIERQAVRTPDYLVQVGDLKLIFEVKQLDEDENFGMVSTHTVGDHIRHKIARAHDQVKWGANQGIPSILLVYNNLDPMHMFGTEDHDFLHAMYGEHTVDINKSTGKITDSYYGDNQSLHENRDSFSAIGRLAPISGKLTVKLFESAYARVKVPFDLLPPCFDVQLVKLR